MDIKEKWKDIIGYEGIYQISSHGSIKSLKYKKERILKPFLDTCGYLSIDLCNHCIEDYRRIHRLVAEAFIPQIVGKNYVNHKDGNKANNNVNNLEWCTASENVTHAYKNGLVSKHPTHQNQPNQISILEVYTNIFYFSIRECARQLGINRDTIRKSLILGIPVKNNTMKFIYANGSNK